MAKEDQNKTNPPSGTHTSKERVKRGYFAFLHATVDFVKEILDIRSQTDKQTAMDMIRADIPFKGHTAWILICSIMIASVGLNADAPAVVIGAMLISPLMGPILGIGMAIAINDIDTLKRSLVNFGVMVGLSVITAFLFYALFPLKIESNELLARTAPDIRDVLIAFFGGLALIIARTKKGTIASVIFGVAIATALMPPLCAAGFGLAVGNIAHFQGAMYLFIINSIYIALATYIVLKVLNFPMERYANSIKRRRIAQLVSLTAFLIMIPAMFTFYKVFQKSLYLRQAQEFVQNEVQPFVFDNGRFISDLTSYDYNPEDESSISLVFLGEDVVSDEILKSWINLLRSEQYNKLKSTRLDINQGGSAENIETVAFLEKLYNKSQENNLSKDKLIANLESELERLKSGTGVDIPFADIIKEAKPIFPELKGLTFDTRIKSDFSSKDTIVVFTPEWSEQVTLADIAKKKVQLTDWLIARCDRETIEVR